MSQHKSKDVNRRTFVKLTTAGGIAGVSMSAAHPPKTQAQFSSSDLHEVSSLLNNHHLKTDVCIIGGGMSGVCAALAAARNGAHVILVQDRSVLGGNSSSEIRMHIVGADKHGSRDNTDSRESGLIEELRLEEAVWNPQRCAELWDVILYDWVMKEPKITLMLNSHCYGVNMIDKHTIQAAYVSRHGTEELFYVEAKLFLDCSGDGRLGAEAGAPFRFGAEARHEFGESMAPLQANDKVLGSSILFTTRKYDKPMPFKAPSFARKFPTCDSFPHRGHGSWEYGYWWVEWGGELDTIKDDERIREELIAVALGVWDHIKNSGCHPESENWALEWVGAIPGKRESRRFIGDYVLREQDLKAGETFADGVAFGGWNIDLHPPKGVYTSEPPYTTIPIELYNIPLGSLYSNKVRNLLFAGRNISASHVAFGSTRVMATCSVIGQAAGTAAALCIKHRAYPKELRKEGIKELQQTLIKDDAYIIDARNTDPYDLARKAQISASSEIHAWQAENVINGVARGVYGHSNRWMSDPRRDMPQWLELRFDSPQRIREVHLTFDTGLNRQLTLSQSDHHTANMIRSAQPETVKDYSIEVLHGDSAHTVVEETGNYYRKRIHRFYPKTADGIRLHVFSTNGSKSASVFEVRAYA